MKRPFIIVIATLVFLTSRSQPIVDFTKFPARQNDTTTFLTKDLLDKINWLEIKKKCTAANGHYAYERKDSLLISYEYVKQGREASFEIVSYKGMVLEYYADAGNTKSLSYHSYFDKTVWLKYMHEMLPDLPHQFKLTMEEPANILKAYYHLLGVNTRDEYGWICEYSTMGMATARRMAIMELLREYRIDLIKRLVEYSNLQTKLYAIDALLYNDYQAKLKITTLEKNRKQGQKQLDSLQKKNVGKTEITALNDKINVVTDSIAYFTEALLTNDDWKKFYDLRDSNQTVRTCGNAGSYKIYGTPISDLLSDKEIADIPKKYERLKSLGYFR